jgi:hypothetical protein
VRGRPRLPLTRYANVYTDTSGVRRFDYLVEAVRRAGAGKVLFGSDGPWLHPGLELAKVRLLGLAPADEALVLGGTALRLIGGVRRAAGAPPPRPTPQPPPALAPRVPRSESELGWRAGAGPVRDPWAAAPPGAEGARGLDE